MSDLFRHTDQARRAASKIVDDRLHNLLKIWRYEDDDVERERLRELAIAMVQQAERDAFLARFALQEFDTWMTGLLTEEEKERSKPDEFYRQPLLEVLVEHGGMWPAGDVIEEVFERVMPKLDLADFKITASHRLRWDSAMRSLAARLKKEGILAKEGAHKNFAWRLAKPQQYRLPPLPHNAVEELREWAKDKSEDPPSWSYRRGYADPDEFDYDDDDEQFDEW